MSKVWAVIVGAFLVGLFAGVYFFFLVHEEAREAPPERGQTDAIEEEGSFEIIADMYGVCMVPGTCPSYKIDSAGRVSYLPEGVNSTPLQEELDLRLQAHLRARIAEADLVALAGRPAPQVCPAASDNPSYRFEITRDGQQVVIDTCVQDVAGHPLIASLIEQFEILAHTSFVP